MALDVTVVVAAALTSLIPAVLAYLSSQKTRRDSLKAQHAAQEQMKSKVDSEAYEKAQRLYDRMIERSREDQDFLRARVTETESRLKQTEEALSRERTRRQYQEIVIADLRRELRYLKQRLRAVGVDVPDEEVEDAQDAGE